MSEYGRDVLLEAYIDNGYQRGTDWFFPINLLYIAQFNSNYVRLTGRWKKNNEGLDISNIVVGFTLI